MMRCPKNLLNDPKLNHCRWMTLCPEATGLDSPSCGSVFLAPSSPFTPPWSAPPSLPSVCGPKGDGHHFTGWDVARDIILFCDVDTPVINLKKEKQKLVMGSAVINQKKHSVWKSHDMMFRIPILPQEKSLPQPLAFLMMNHLLLRTWNGAPPLPWFAPSTLPYSHCNWHAVFGTCSMALCEAWLQLLWNGALNPPGFAANNPLHTCCIQEVPRRKRKPESCAPWLGWKAPSSVSMVQRLSGQ